VSTKVCKDCGAEKPIEEFPRNIRMRNGRLNRCKPCEYERVAQWRAENPDRVKANNIATRTRVAVVEPGTLLACKKCDEAKPLSEFHPQKGAKFGVRRTCKKCLLAEIAAEHKESPEIRRQRCAQWVKEHPESASAVRKKSYRKHREKRLQYRKVWRANNLDRDRQREKNYLKNNRSVVYAKNARRRAAETRAVPKWLTAIHKAQIQEFYEIAIAREMQTGEKHHVDHIVPLRGDGVFGLHVPWNLQVLTEFENCSKHNKMLEVRS
jgi:hypothetical protein